MSRETIRRISSKWTKSILHVVYSCRFQGLYQLGLRIPPAAAHSELLWTASL